MQAINAGTDSSVSRDKELRDKELRDSDLKNGDLKGRELNDSDQFLTFIMNNEEYGVNILCVQEIRGWESATPLPNAPPHIKGVINLRGTIVPIIDLRQCFGLTAIQYTPVTVVIVLKVETVKGSRIMGIVVDAVSEVYTIAAKDMKAPPDLGDAVDTDYIRGLVAIDKKMVILLEIDKLLSMDELPDLSAIANVLDQ